MMQPSSAAIAKPVEPRAFIRQNAPLAPTGLVPDVRLCLARDPLGIWQAAEAAFGTGPSARPFWAFAWPGGQALARYIINHPGDVAGRHVVDLGCGSGIAGIVAAMAGAALVTAVDHDPVALAAVGINAAANGVRVVTAAADVHAAALPRGSVLLVGDLVYEPKLAAQVARIMVEAARGGAHVLFGDRTTSPELPLSRECLARYPASTLPALEPDAEEQGAVWRVGGG
jgi:predicted nicotinamide N-methyase